MLFKILAMLQNFFGMNLCPMLFATGDFTGIRTSATSGSSNENRHVRYVDERIFLYAPQYAPLLLLKGGIVPGVDGARVKVKGIIESGFVPSKKVEWYEKDLLDQDLYMAAALGSTSTTSISVDNGAGALTKVPRVGDVIEVVSANPTMGEQMLIQAITIGSTQSTLTVVRDVGGTTGATLSDNAVLRVVSNAQKENSAALTKRGRYADAKYNYMQISRDDWGLSRSDDRIRLYGGRDKAESMAEAAVNHCRVLERSLNFGGRDSTTDADGNEVLLTGGLRYWIPNVYAAADANCAGLFAGATGHGGTISVITEFLETFLREGFRFGNIRRKKIFIAGSVWGIIFNRAITGTTPATGSIRAKSKDTSFGVAITELVSAFGTIDFLPSGAIEEFSNGEGYLIDPENVKFCYLDNTFMVDNAQNPDVDGYAGYFLTEYALKVLGLKTHSRISGVTGAA